MLTKLLLCLIAIIAQCKNPVPVLPDCNAPQMSYQKPLLCPDGADQARGEHEILFELELLHGDSQANTGPQNLPGLHETGMTHRSQRQSMRSSMQKLLRSQTHAA